MEKLLLKVTDAADVASIGRSTVYELIRAGVWPVVRIGRSVRIPQKAVEAWIAQQVEGSGVASID